MIDNLFDKLSKETLKCNETHEFYTVIGKFNLAYELELITYDEKRQLEIVWCNLINEIIIKPLENKFEEVLGEKPERY